MNQYQLQLSPKSRGFHIITSEILEQIPALPNQGILHVFCQHTSCGITINENADPTVLEDFEFFFNRMVPENLSGLKHTIEGVDDMPAHIKSSLVGCQLSIPIVKGELALGTWQGIYLCEFRNYGGARKLLVSLMT